MLIGLFALGFFAGSRNVRGSANDIEYEFENDYLYNGDLESTSEQFNTRNMTARTGHFNGTYSFEDEQNGDYTSDPSLLSFVNYALVGSDTSIRIGDFNGHSKVLSVISRTGATTTNLHHYFNTDQSEYRTNLITEFWFCLNDTTDTKWKSITWKSAGINTAHVYFYTDDIKIFDGTTSIIIGENVLSDNTWNHLKTIFNDSNDCFDVFFNGELIGNDCDARGDMSAGCSNMIIQAPLDTDIVMGFDAIGFSDDNYYAIGDNFYPYVETNRNPIYAEDFTIMHDTIYNNGNVNDTYSINAIGINMSDDQSNPRSVQIMGNFSDFSASIGYLDLTIFTNDSNELRSFGFGVFESVDLYVSTYEEIINDDDYGNLIDRDFRDIQFNYQPCWELWVSDADGFEIILDFLAVNYLPFNRTETDKFEFAYNETNDLITDMGGLVNWTYSGDSLSVQSTGYDNIIEYDAIDSVTNYISLGFDYDDSDMIEMDLDASHFDVTGSSSKDVFLHVNFFGADTNIKNSFCFRVFHDGSRLYSMMYYSTDQETLIGHSSDYTMLLFEEIEEPAENENGYGDISFVAYVNYFVLEYRGEIYNMTASNVDFSEIQITFISGDTGDREIYIDYIRVLVNGISVSGEGTMEIEGFYPISSETWDFDEYNFIEIELNSLKINNITISLNDEFVIGDYGDFMTERYFINVYDGERSFLNPYFHIVNDSTWEITNVAIYGIKMTNNLGETIIPTWNHENIDLNNSYFYVENSRLKYTILGSATNLGNIELVFNIDNVFDEDYAIEFTTQTTVTGDFQSYFTLDYVSGMDYSYVYREATTTDTFSLGSNRYVDKFQFTTSDSDEIVMGNRVYGQIYDITFVYLPDLEFSFTITTLIYILVPILILTLVPFAFSIKLGKNAIIPVFLLMALILTLTSLIPVWLFFIILVGCVLFLFGKNRYEERV